MSVSEDHKAKLREFIEAGQQLCLAQERPAHTPPSFHWETDAGQNSPEFILLESHLIAAANDMLKSGALEREPKQREYLHIQFTRLHLKAKCP